MPQNQDVIAIYSRKSRFTSKGESIGNQVEPYRAAIRTVARKVIWDGQYAHAVLFGAVDEDVG